MPFVRATINYVLHDDNREAAFFLEITADVRMPTRDHLVPGGSWEPGTGADVEIRRVTCEKIVNNYGERQIERKPGLTEAAAVAKWLVDGTGFEDCGAESEVRELLATEAALSDEATRGQYQEQE